MKPLPLCKHECLREGRRYCCGTQVGVYGCTRDPGHRGPHVACGGRGDHATVVWGRLRPVLAVGEVLFVFVKTPDWGNQWELWRVVELRGNRAKVENVLGPKQKPRWFGAARLRYAPQYFGPLPEGQAPAARRAGN